MKFMVEFRIHPESRNKMMDLFELRGPNRIPGVSFRGAWIGTQSGVIFVLGESTEESLIEQACRPWREFGSYEIHPVVDVEQY